MNREIKFRGKRKDTEGWVCGDLIHTPEGKVRIIGFVDKSFDDVLDYDTFNHEVIPETVGQFWFSKNGEHFYDGDRVLVRGTKRVGEYETEIVFGDYGFKLKENKTYMVDTAVRSVIIKVIGNVHDKEQ